MVEPVIRSILVANSAVNSAVGGVIRPAHLGMPDERPAIVFEINGTEELTTLDAASTHFRESFAVHVLADTAILARSIAMLVRAALHYYMSASVSGTGFDYEVSVILHDGTSDATPPAELGMEIPIAHYIGEYHGLFKSNT